MARQFQASEVLSECLQPPPTSPHLRPQHSRTATGCCWTPVGRTQTLQDFSFSPEKNIENISNLYF